MQRMILVVEADRVLREAVTATLREEGYIVLVVADETTALEVARYNLLSLVILDPLLRRPGGLEGCRALRTLPELAHVPILLVAPSESEIAQLVELELDVDGYLTKPLRWEELRACARTLLRSGRRRSTRRGKRTPITAVPHAETGGEEGHLLVADDLCIDIARRKVIRRNQPIELDQALLFDLLVYLVRYRGVVLTRERLLEHVWGYDPTMSTRTVDVHVRWLRQKLEDDPDHPHLIETIRGVGYRFKE